MSGGDREADSLERLCHITQGHDAPPVPSTFQHHLVDPSIDLRRGRRDEYAVGPALEHVHQVDAAIILSAEVPNWVQAKLGSSKAASACGRPDLAGGLAGEGIAEADVPATRPSRMDLQRVLQSGIGQLAALGTGRLVDYLAIEQTCREGDAVAVPQLREVQALVLVLELGLQARQGGRLGIEDHDSAHSI